MESRLNYSTDTLYRKHRKSMLKALCFGLLYTSPVILGYIIFVLVPLVVTMFLSMTDYSIGSLKTNFVGLKNYRDMFTGQDIYFYPSIKATLYYVLGSVPLSIVFSFIIAVLLNSRIKFKTFFRGLFYLPVIIPLVAGCSIWLWMLQPDFGIVNQLLKAVGLPGSRWLTSDTTVIPTFILFSLWICGNTIVIFLAGLQNIPVQLFEALDVDGGNAWHKLVYVIIPMSSPIIFFNTVIGVINAFQCFVPTAILTPGQGPNIMGQPGNAGLLIVPNIYIKAFTFSQMGSASATAVILLVIIAIFTVVFFKLQKNLVYYEAGGKTK